MRRRRLFAGLGLAPTVALLLMAFTATSVLAAPCYGSNNGAARDLTSETASKGLKTVADLKAGTPQNPNTTAIVHPAQIIPTTGDFVGWGTAKGVGVDDCPTNTSTRWALYVDGIAFGQYFCRQDYGSQPNVADNQTIEIKHTTCNGSTKWAFYWNGNLKTCQAINTAGGFPSVGGESIGFDTQTIDIHYRNLQYRVLGGTWEAWHVGQSTCVSTGYQVILSGFDDVFVKD